jgi:predicted ATPase/DNA-binding winged helix-turn-helix (wHTH) protein
MSSETTELHFGNACLDLSRRRLLLDGKPAKLGARAFDLLAALAQRRERALTKHELFELVWPGVVVEENNLQVQISTLRKLLGPDAIATIPGRGYQFVAPLDRDVPVAPPGGAPGEDTTQLSRTPPAQHEPIVGRSQEICEVTDLLHQHALVSIIGAGGIGKTRLALAVAEALDGEYPDGIWWIELAATNDAAMVPAIIAQALQLAPVAHRSTLDSVVSLLRHKTTLVVLDNCEHLLDAVAEVVAVVLRECRGVRILVTSQENLKLHGEHVYRLGGLAVPAPGEPVAADAGAVALFVARAQAADPHLRFDEARLATAAAICRSLDGIALAIELAAARVPLLGVEGLHQRLGERFRILTGGARMALRRHQTLRAALEWSHSLLTPGEQTVFRRLGVFAGGFPLELAQAVAADDVIDRWQVVELLGQLIDKSLVVADSGPVPRYRLLETTRAFALESLAAAGETVVLLRRHAQALTDELAVQHAAYWTLTEAESERAPRELDNLRSALDWAESPDGDRRLAVALMAVSYRVWHATGQLLEGIERCRRLLPLPDGLALQIEASFWLVYGRLGYLGARAECYDAAGRAAALFRRLGDRSRLADALLSYAMMGARRGATEETRAAIAEAEANLSGASPARQRATLALAQSVWSSHRGRCEESLAAVLRQAACYREDGLEFGVQLALSTAGLWEAVLGRYEAAIERLNTALTELRRLNARTGMGNARGYLSVAYALRGRGDDLIKALTFGREAWPDVVREQRSVWLLASIALAHARLGELETAALLLGKIQRVRIEEDLIAAPFWAPQVAEVEQAVLGALGSAKAQALVTEGAALSDEAAAALAFPRSGDVALPA